jgi:homoserine kinase
MEYGQSIKIKAPATIANMVCGFDILGFAVAEPYDEMTITLKKEPGISIVHTDDHGLPTEPDHNVAGVALHAMLAELTMPAGFHVSIHKHIKPGSGLGSSAASAAGAVVAANYLLGEVFNKESLVQFAMHGEKLASGVKHADNITPCIYGGITLIRSIFPLDIIPLQPPPLFVTIVHPQIEVKTADARSILKKQVYLKDAIKQWGNIAGLVSGLLQRDYALIGRSLEDVIIEPVRSILIPGVDEIKEKSKSVGALGGGISGSGPSIFMLSQSLETAQLVEIQMKEVFQRMNLLHYTYVTTVSSKGVQLFSE